ncbi:polysaccharide deacetylase family protein [Thermodesulfobacteriota bacterium]
MNKIIKKMILRTICQLKLPKLLHKSIVKNDLTIITYHGIIDKQLKVPDWCFLEKDQFCKQIDYLKKTFNVLHLSKAVELIKKGQLEDSIAVITFDDGFQNNFDIAFPILKDAGIPATIFLTTKYIDTADTLWFCKFNNAFNRTLKKVLHWNGKQFDIDSTEKKTKAAIKLQIKLKSLPTLQMRHEVKTIIGQLYNNHDYQVELDSPYRMLSINAIRKMKEPGLIEFGAHSHTHEILSKLSFKEKKEEIKKSISEFEKIVKTPCRLFSYPNGGVNDFDDETICILESFGIETAVSMIPGPNIYTTPLMSLRRYGIRNDISIEKFKTLVHHLNWKYNKF